MDGRRIHIGADKDIGVDKSAVRFVREKAPIRAGSFSDPGRIFFYSRGFVFCCWVIGNRNIFRSDPKKLKNSQNYFLFVLALFATFVR